MGTKSKPFYRVVVQDESAAPRSKVVEILGVYRPLKEPTAFEVDRDKTLDWIKKGAEPTEKVRILLGKAGILPPVDLASLPKRKKKTEAPAEVAAEAPKPVSTEAAVALPAEGAGKEEQK